MDVEGVEGVGKVFGRFWCSWFLVSLGVVSVEWCLLRFLVVFLVGFWCVSVW